MTATDFAPAVDPAPAPEAVDEVKVDEKPAKVTKEKKTKVAKEKKPKEVKAAKAQRRRSRRLRIHHTRRWSWKPSPHSRSALAPVSMPSQSTWRTSTRRSSRRISRGR